MSEPVRELFPGETVEMKQEYPMRWHGFLAKCLLWIMAAHNVFQAAWIVLGKIYYTPAARDAVYEGLPALMIADYALAALLLGGAILQLAAGSGLRRRRKAGIRCLMAAYIMLAAAQPAHMLARFVISGLPPLNLNAIAWTAAHLLLLAVNRSYYSKRRGLFDRA